MKIPNTLKRNFIHGWINEAEDIITDFRGYKQVKVAKADSEMIDAQPNCCIDNSIALAEYGDLDVVQGYIVADIEDPKLGIFHYWNYCPDQNVYWDSTPLKNNKIRYFIKEETE
jgi:hypothetical protein